MHDFTPISAVIGGVFIGIAATLYLLFSGRYAGISGILRGAVFGEDDRGMDLLFILGLLAGGVLWALFAGKPDALGAPLPLVAVGGVLVGLGTCISHGCTSGHGVCGLGRKSASSLAAVATFLATGIATVFVIHHLGGVPLP